MAKTTTTATENAKPFDPIADFNAGKPVKVVKTGSIDEGSYMFHVETITLERSKFDAQNGDPQYQFNILCWLDDDKHEVSDKDLTAMIFQNVKFTPNGEMRNPAYPGFTAKDGKEVPPSQLYEILQAAKVTDPEAYEKAKKDGMDKEGGMKWMKFVKGLKFEFPAKVGDRNDGTGKFVILLTSKQEIKDEEYQAKRNEGYSTDREPATEGYPADFPSEQPEEVNTQTKMSTGGDNIIDPSDLPF